jgi:hypothetical protein
VNFLRFFTSKSWSYLVGDLLSFPRCSLKAKKALVKIGLPDVILSIFFNIIFPV